MPISRARFATFIAIPLVVIGGALAYAHQGGNHGHRSPADTQHFDMHLDHMAAMLTRIGASDSQKSQIDGILRGAFANLKTVKDDHQLAFGRFHELLFAPAIDRAQVEALRAGQIKAIDDASRNIVTAFEDAAEVLSPEQRAALAEAVRKHHGG
jgi:Spy/CpxP family protein refolding chaperone